MATDLPEYYFRIRENGAVVFRVDTANRMRRIDLDQIAVVNLRTGDIRAHAGAELSDKDLDHISLWMTDRKAIAAARDVDDIHRATDQLNMVAQWAQARATPDQLEAVTDRLLMAMHDLRTVLVRKKADRLSKQVDSDQI